MSSMQKSQNHLRYFKKLPLALGLNFGQPSKYDYHLKILSISIAVISWGCVYGNFQFIAYYFGKDPLTAMEAFMTGLQVCLAVIKFMYVISIQEKFAEIIQVAEKNKVFSSFNFPNHKLKEKCEDILNSTLKSSKFQLCFIGVGYFGIIGYYFCDAIIRNLIKHYLLRKENYIRLFPLPAYFPGFDMESFPFHELEFIVVGVGDYCAGFAQMSFDGNFIVLIQHSVGLFRVLQQVIVEIDNVPEGQKDVYLKNCIEFNRKCLSFYYGVNDIYRKTGILQLVSSLGVIGVSIFTASEGLKDDFQRLVRSVIYFFAAVCQVGLYCLNGQLLTNESEELNFSWYSVDWYNRSKEFRKLIYMSMIRSSKQAYVEATGFTSMSRTTFMSVRFNMNNEYLNYL